MSPENHFFEALPEGGESGAGVENERQVDGRTGVFGPGEMGEDVDGVSAEFVVHGGSGGRETGVARQDLHRMAIHSNLGGIAVEVHSPKSVHSEGHTRDVAVDRPPGVADRWFRMDGQLSGASHIKFIPAEAGEVYFVLRSRPVLFVGNHGAFLNSRTT